MSKLYSKKIFRHSANPKNKGTLDQPTHTFEAQNPSCGDDLTFFLEVDAAGSITRASWQGQGCALSQASASIFSEMIIGKTLAEVAAISSDELLTLFDIAISPARSACALLPLDALHHSEKK